MKEMIIKHKNSIIFYLFIIVIIFILSVTNYTVDPDYWARLLQGYAYLDLGNILETDPFSYTNTHIWLDHEWGSSVIFAIVQRYLGLKGIIVFKSILILLLFVFIYNTINLSERKDDRLFDVLFFLLALYAMQTLTFSGLRCHFFTFLFFSMFLYILEKVRISGKKSFLIFLPIIMLLWCNMHGGCVSGLGLIFLYAIGEALNKKPFKNYFLILLLCCCALFTNPYGIDYVKFIFMATTMQRDFITEWISPFFHPVWNFMLVFKILFIANLFVILFQIKKVKEDWTKYLILIVCTYLSFKYVKNTPFLVIASMSLLYSDFEYYFNKYVKDKITEKYNKTYIFILLTIAVILITFSVNIKNNDFNLYSQEPVKVVEFLKTNGLKGRIVAPLDMGSFLAYKMFPDMLIYMDGRYEEVYYEETKTLLDNFYNVTKDGYKILNSQPEYVIVPSNALLNDYMLQREDYKLIYTDNDNFLYAYINELKDSYLSPKKDNNILKMNFDYNSIIRDNNNRIIFFNLV